jgi:hypothetical protein
VSFDVRQNFTMTDNLTLLINDYRGNWILALLLLVLYFIIILIKRLSVDHRNAFLILCFIPPLQMAALFGLNLAKILSHIGMSSLSDPSGLIAAIAHAIIPFIFSPVLLSVCFVMAAILRVCRLPKAKTTNLSNKALHSTGISGAAEAASAYPVTDAAGAASAPGLRASE